MRLEEGKKQLFCEKKNQKTFAFEGATGGMRLLF
jgi:hypothetical protein